MRSNRLRRCLVVSTLCVGATTASAQNKTEATDDKAAPDRVAQAAPDPAQPESPPAGEPAPTTGPSTATDPSPQTPGAREPDEQLRKMIDEQVAKGLKPKGPYIEFSGYARAAVGLAIRGGKQVCFGLPGADTKWRLGNECDYVIEPQFTGRLLTLADKSSWGIVVMPGLYRTFEDPNGDDKTFFSNLPAEFRQLYFFGENIPQLLNGRVWGGRRYYDRLHLDINDQFLEIDDSDGAGIEDMQLGFGKLSVAFLMNPNSEANGAPLAPPAMGEVSSANIAPFRLTARLTDIKTAPEGSLQVWAAFYGTSTSEDQAEDAIVNKPDNRFRFGVYHTLGKVLGGSNFVGAKLEYGTNRLLWRAVVQEQMVVNNGHTSVDVIGEFRSTRERADEDSDWATNNWGSLGGRVDTQIQGPFRFSVEAGWDRVFPETGDAPQLIKATGCLSINAGDSAGSRPTFRLFYTHGFWNDAAKGLYAAGAGGQRLAQVYGDKNNGGSFGIQAEAWW